MRSALFAGEVPRYGSADSPIIEFAMRTTLRTIEIIFIRILWPLNLCPIPPSIAIAPLSRDSSSTCGPQRLKPQSLGMSLQARVELMPSPVRDDDTVKHKNSVQRNSPVPRQYFLGRGGIRLASTASNSNFGSSASGAKVAFVVFIQFLSSRSGKSGL
jgi:hypothetical protein